MADNAPNSVNRPPFPNVVCQFNRRVDLHVLTFTGANGSATIVSGSSTAGVSVTYVGEGNYTIAFPAGGTGAIGWITISPPAQPGETVTDGRFYSIDSDIQNFATGAARFSAFDGSATPALSDIIGTVCVQVYVVKA